MTASAPLPKRRRLVLGINIIIILLIGFPWLFSFLQLGNEIAASLIISLIVLPFLGLFQYCCVVYNILKGSRMQVYYLLGSLVFLALYVLNAMGHIQLFDIDDEDFGLQLFFGLPLLAAIIYCYILYIDHPAGYQKRSTLSDTLDNEMF